MTDQPPALGEEPDTRPRSATDREDAETRPANATSENSVVAESEKDEASSGEEEEDDDDDEDEDEEDDEDEDDEEEEEPRLKYARLTQHLGGVYRNGDATSSFLVAGDKMVSSRRSSCMLD